MEPYSLHRPQYFSAFSMVVTFKCSDDDSSGNMALISLFISSETEGFLKLYRWPVCGAISMKNQQVPFDQHCLVFPRWNLCPLKKLSCCMIRKGPLASIHISPTNCWDIVGYDANIWASSTWFYAVHLVESKEGPAEEKKGMVSSWYTLRQPTVKFGRSRCGPHQRIERCMHANFPGTRQ